MGRHRDKRARTVETLCDLDLAFAGAESLASRSEPSEGGRWTAALARACSVFLRKMVIGDWNDSSTRLLDRSVLESAGLSFHRLRKIPRERRTLGIEMSFPGAMMKATKLDEATGRPEATIGLPFAPHKLAISIEWP